MNDDSVIDDETAPEKTAQLPDGIYIRLDEDLYHAQQRLSSSGISKIHASEADFWASSWMNPEHEDKTTDAQLLGRAFHTARLEPEMLDQRFVREIDKADFPDALFTDAEVRAKIKELQPKKEDHPDVLQNDAAVKRALKEAGEKQTIGEETPDDRKVRLRAVSAGVVFWDDIIADFEGEFGPISAPDGETPLGRAIRLEGYGYGGPIWSIEVAKFEVERGERTSLPVKFWDQVQADVKAMASNDIAKRYLSDGIAEVSILWTDETDPETPIPMKCRIDYLKAEQFCDAKTFENVYGKPVRDCIADAFRFNGYYRQARFYLEGTEQIRCGGLEIMDAATDREREIIAQIQIAPHPLSCTYVFQQKRGVPNVFGCPVMLHKTHASLRAAATGDAPTDADIARRYADTSLLARRAEHDIATCIETFRACVKKYGMDGTPWEPLCPEWIINDEAFSGFWLEGNW